MEGRRKLSSNKRKGTSVDTVRFSTNVKMMFDFEKMST